MINEFKARMDFRYFNEEVLKIHFPEYHYNIFYDWVKSGKPYACIELARGHGKSLFWNTAYLSWREFRENGFKACQISASLNQSTNLSDGTATAFESIEFLKKFVPSSKTDSWSKQNKDFTNGNKLEVRPFSSNARGGHYDLLIADDILRDADLSITQAKDIFWTIIFPMVQTRKGNLVFVGTPMSMEDLFHEIEDNIKLTENKTDWFFAKVPAVITDELENWVEPLWKDRFTLEELKKIEDSMGKARFAREYLLNPISSGSGFYEKSHIINSLSSAMSFEYDSIKGCMAYGGSDFAISQSARADMSATFVINVLEGEQEIDFGDHKRKIINPIIVRYGYSARGMTYANQLDYQQRIYKQYNLSCLVLDKTNFGIKFYEDLRGKLNIDGQDFPVAKRNALLYNLQNIFESGRLVLPYKDNELQTKHIIKELVSQLNGFSLSTETNSVQSRARHDDLAIALALAVKKISPQNNDILYNNYIYTQEDLDNSEEDASNEDNLIYTNDMFD